MYKKNYQSLNLLNKRYDFVVCASLETLNYYYKKSLPRNCTMNSSSPSVLKESKVNSQHLHEDWKTKILKFLESLYLVLV